MMKSFLSRLSQVLSGGSKDEPEEKPASQSQQQSQATAPESVDSAPPIADEPPAPAVTDPAPAPLAEEVSPAPVLEEPVAEEPVVEAEPEPVEQPVPTPVATAAAPAPVRKQKKEASVAVAAEDSAPPAPIQPICFFFEAHQPNRLKPYSFFDIGHEENYEDDELNNKLLNEICDKSYLPANKLMKELIEEGEGNFRISLSISGVLLEKLEKERPDVLKSFQELHATGGVEIVAETYYHSISFHRSKEEFAEQVQMQVDKIESVFGVKPKAFRHTACVYYNELAAFVEGLGFESMLGEAVGRILDGREANYLYRSPNVKEMKVHLRNGILSDDIAFRFGNHAWPEHPLTAEKYARWCQTNGGEIINLFMDYECLGYHQEEETGIFKFLKAFPREWAKLGGRFVTVSEANDEFDSAGIYDCHEPTSWADLDKDLSPWKGNAMQEEARRKILNMEELVKSKNCPKLLHRWRKMQTAEHFYYMSTKGGECGDFHDRLRPYPSAYDAYLYFMNALSDLQIRLEEE
ncbi:glycoside hydrolase family 57 protein [Roseibacillus ishigakijimensis]|uniref:Glycoside hydrolase family 57 protein n=1 Tax=Roseibacillus ishigakijimensis TaxID=454146 RepID=A0A934VLG9_9BACT|nr:glycoside hydrolase family 57 protein [Roseibacillus ishigakijimensis]MBK1832880.1 glycoside hydrolase family 57 protein [Roseibacillus ishigakijimensis]